jgi:hypothetical protein
VEVEMSNGSGGGINGDDLDSKKPVSTTKSETRDLLSIKTVFKETNVPRVIDYFSLDVEGAESLVMADFTWEEYVFLFITIERPREDIKEALKEHGYKLVKTLVVRGEAL